MQAHANLHNANVIISW